MPSEDIIKACEHDFQNGAGRAQVRDKTGQLRASRESIKQASSILCTDWGETLWWRGKVRGKNQFVWRQAA